MFRFSFTVCFSKKHLFSSLKIIGPCGFKIDDKHVRRAGLDYWEHVDFEFFESWEKFKLEMHKFGKPFFITKKGDINLWDAKFFSEEKGLEIVDVQRDLEYVVDNISSSKACISTSLHGLIISQAYGVPWVWLEIVDDNLRGDDFKFKDFFSTLNESQVVRVRVTLQELAGLDLKVIASKASLPDKQYKEELILGAIEARLASLSKL